MPNFANTQDLVDLEEIREGTVVLKSGRLIHILMVDGINFSLKSEQEQGIITYGYQNFLNSVDFPVQIIVHSRKINIEGYLAKLDERERNESSGLLQNQIAEYREFIASFVKENAIMQKTFFVVVPFSPTMVPTKESVAKFLPFFKKKNGAAEEKRKAAQSATFAQNLSQLRQRTEQVVGGLQTIGLDVVQLGDEELAELFYNFYNPETVEREQMGLIPEATQSKPQQ